MKIGWALSGGGDKGAYEAGLLKRQTEQHPDDEYPVIRGTSTGALIAGPFGMWAVTKDIKHITNMVEIYSTVRKGDILKPSSSIAHAIGGDIGLVLAQAISKGISAYSTKPLLELIDRFMTKDDWKLLIEAGKRKKSGVDVGFVAVSLQTGKARVFSNVTDPDPDVLRLAMLASASQPVLMPPVEIQGEQFVDGGLRDMMPLQHMFSSTFTNELDMIYAVSLQQKGETGGSTKKVKNIAQAMMATLSTLIASIRTEDVTTAGLWNVLLKVKELITDEHWTELLENLPEDLADYVDVNLEDKRFIPVHHIEPLHPISGSGLDFEQPAMRKLLKRGYVDAKKLLPRLGLEV